VALAIPRRPPKQARPAPSAAGGAAGEGLQGRRSGPPAALAPLRAHHSLRHTWAAHGRAESPPPPGDAGTTAHAQTAMSLGASAGGAGGAGEEAAWPSRSSTGALPLAGRAATAAASPPRTPAEPNGSLGAPFSPATTLGTTLGSGGAGLGTSARNPAGAVAIDVEPDAPAPRGERARAETAHARGAAAPDTPGGRGSAPGSAGTRAGYDSTRARRRGSWSEAALAGGVWVEPEIERFTQRLADAAAPSAGSAALAAAALAPAPAPERGGAALPAVGHALALRGGKGAPGGKARRRAVAGPRGAGSFGKKAAAAAAAAPRDTHVDRARLISGAEAFLQAEPRAAPPPSRTNWTRLVPSPVLNGHVSSPPAAARPSHATRHCGPQKRARASRRVPSGSCRRA
jgi:hypothetical protein